jgi:hypothetical protein
LLQEAKIEEEDEEERALVGVEVEEEEATEVDGTEKKTDLILKNLEEVLSQ